MSANSRPRNTPSVLHLDAIPHDIQDELERLSLSELNARLLRATIGTVRQMAEAGWVLMMIKRKVGFQNFTDYLKELEYEYSFANTCMRFAHVIVAHPLFADLAQNVVKQVIRLSEAERAQIEDDLQKGIKAGLLPWELKRRAQDLIHLARDRRVGMKWARFLQHLKSIADTALKVTSLQLTPDERQRLLALESFVRLKHRLSEIQDWIAVIEKRDNANAPPQK